MQPAGPAQPQTPQQDPDAFVTWGGWLFKRRTSLPLPIVAALLLVPSQPVATWVVWLGAAIVAVSELTRLWAVRQIGVISRTRSDRLGPLVASGPFGWVRNPLYLGNIGIWIGFTLSARLPMLVPVVALFLGLTYHAIVRWEEQLLVSRIGDAYHRYMAMVPRWIPRLQPVAAERPESAFSWTETLFSERGTLIAIVSGYVLLYVKQRLF
jgi:protein-S-isoprenylcysteine O-methyltransferase Ste14